MTTSCTAFVSECRALYHRKLLEQHERLRVEKYNLLYQISALQHNFGVNSDNMARCSLNRIHYKLYYVKTQVDSIDCAKQQQLIDSLLEARHSFEYQFRNHQYAALYLTCAARTARWLPFDAEDCVGAALIRENAYLRTRLRSIARQNLQRHSALCEWQNKLADTLKQVRAADKALLRRENQITCLDSMMCSYHYALFSTTQASLGVKNLQETLDHIRLCAKHLEANFGLLTAELRDAKQRYDYFGGIREDLERLGCKYVQQYNSIRNATQGKQYQAEIQLYIQGAIDNFARYKADILNSQQAIMRMVRNCGDFEHYCSKQRYTQRMLQFLLKLQYKQAYIARNLSLNYNSERLAGKMRLVFEDIV